MCGPAAADGHCVVVDAVDGGGGDDVSDHDGKGQDDASYFSSYRLQHVVLAFRTVLILPVNAMDTFILRFFNKKPVFRTNPACIALGRRFRKLFLERTSAGCQVLRLCRFSAGCPSHIPILTQVLKTREMPKVRS